VIYIVGCFVSSVTSCTTLLLVESTFGHLLIENRNWKRCASGKANVVTSKPDRIWIIIVKIGHFWFLHTFIFVSIYWSPASWVL